MCLEMKHHFALTIDEGKLEYKNRIGDRESLGNLNSSVHSVFLICRGSCNNVPTSRCDADFVEVLECFNAYLCFSYL